MIGININIPFVNSSFLWWSVAVGVFAAAEAHVAILRERQRAEAPLHQRSYGRRHLCRLEPQTSIGRAVVLQRGESLGTCLVGGKHDAVGHRALDLEHAAAAVDVEQLATIAVEAETTQAACFAVERILPAVATTRARRFALVQRLGTFQFTFRSNGIGKALNTTQL